MLTNSAGEALQLGTPYTHMHLLNSSKMLALHVNLVLHTGVTVWERSKAEVVDGHANVTAAQLQGLHMGLLAAQHFAFKDVNIVMPHDQQLLQVCVPDMSVTCLISFHA